MSEIGQTSHLKREILVRVIKSFLSGNFEENVRLIPYDMRPKGCDVPYRCCVYKERAILKDRIIAGLGFSIEDDDELTLLSTYAKNAIEREKPDEKPLTVLEAACKGCVPSRVYVTDICQGCVARPCQNACKFGAISFKDGKSVIDGSKCKGCTKCMQVCPYSAIVKLRVPCEDSCPVGAIEKDENGHARIDFDECISCGKCVSACPFGAVHEKSQIIDVLTKIKQGKRVVAMFAPALLGQLPCTPEQLHTAIKKLGFSEVYEVAQGADCTTRHEAEDFIKRIDNGDDFMTTSCCAGYNQLVDKTLTEMKPFVSSSQTPVYYAAEIIKKELPDSVIVFLSPCVAKRKECSQNPNVDYMINFEELGAWFIAQKVEVATCEPEEYKHESSKEGRNYCLTGGVAGAVEAVVGDKAEIKVHYVNGLNKQSIRDLKKFAKTGKCEFGNMIEVMACEGGCIAGNATINSLKTAIKQVKSCSENSKSINELPPES
ncbi:monomeric [FeFe] hydrogenase [bacterium]|nr:monomeric [FeFe] hydrogenase [bacterium]